MADYVKDHIEFGDIQTDVVTLNSDTSTIQVYTHGAINTLHSNNIDVTAQRNLETQLVSYVNVYLQRGGSPFMGPMAGRYGDETDVESLPQRIAQPGPQDIHGVFAGMGWNIQDINTNEGSVTMNLSAEKWKNELKSYYYFATGNSDRNSEERRSLDRLIRATERRYLRSSDIQNQLGNLSQLVNTKRNKQFDSLVSAIDSLVELAYPGDLDIVRKITIEDYNDKTVTSFLDEVWLSNASKITNAVDASGYHTYFNTLLEEIVVPDGFWPNNHVPEIYDDNLPDVSVRELDQVKRLGRRLFIIPLGEFQTHNANQIIYKDQNTVGVPEVAIENWRQQGDDRHYPEMARIIKPGEASYVGMRVIVVQGKTVPKNIQDYVDQINSNIKEA